MTGKIAPSFYGLDTANLLGSTTSSFTASQNCYAVITFRDYSGDGHLYLDGVEIIGVFYGTPTYTVAGPIIPLKAGQTLSIRNGGFEIKIYGLK